MANGLFSYDEIEKAKKQTFLKVYDDLFHKHSGIDHKTIALKDLKGKLIGRGAILKMMKFPITSVFFLKKSTSKKIIVLVLLMWNGFIWQLVMIMIFTNVHRLNAELKRK